MPPHGFPKEMFGAAQSIAEKWSFDAITTQEKDRMCDSLVQKIKSGAPLDDAEKSHLAVCECCIAQVVRTLDESATREMRGSGMPAGTANGDLVHARPEATKALEQGRRVFEREFAISFAKD